MRLRRILALAMAWALLLAALGGAALAANPADMPYRIEVDISSQIVTIYANSNGEIVRQMLCSTGGNNETPTGDFIMQPDRGRDRKPWYWIPKFHCYVRYASRIRGQLLFHSLPYREKSLFSLQSEPAEKFGYPASHGCVRLRWEDARFIAENCLPGTAVRITKSGERKEDLRQLLFQSAFDASKGFSYDEFLGVTSVPGALGWGSESQEVLNLQYRLRDLGIYDGDMTGEYGSKTVNAVRAAQYLLGDALNGVATEEFRQRIFSDDAPTAMNVKLTEGMGGPAVRKLQENLAALRLYGEDELDSVYDVGVSEAVRAFQRAYCYNPDGVATSAVQKAIDYEAGKVLETFDGVDYECEQAADKLGVARVAVAAGAVLRESASPQGKRIKSLKDGATAIVVKRGNNWTRVRSGGEEGYLKNSLIEYAELELSLLKYTCEADDRVYTVGNAAADYYAGASLPCEVFAEYLAANEQATDLSSLVNYVTVDTHGEASALNLREGPDAASPVLDTVADGESLRVERQFTEWTQVISGGQAGYLMNRYLNFWTGPEDALEAGEEEEQIDASLVDYALVESLAEVGASVYDGVTEAANLLGHLPDATRLNVLAMQDGWCLIEYNGRQGYMDMEDLRLVMKNEEAT